jgi:hypothetical protein
LQRHKNNFQGYQFTRGVKPNGLHRNQDSDHSTLHCVKS